MFGNRRLAIIPRMEFQVRSAESAERVAAGLAEAGSRNHWITGPEVAARGITLSAGLLSPRGRDPTVTWYTVVPLGSILLEVRGREGVEGG